MPKTKPSKFKRWYANPKNRKKLLARKKKKYHDDPEVREKQINYGRLSYWDKKKRIVLRAIKKYVEPSSYIGTIRPSYAYTIEDVAQLFSKHERTIRGWIHDKVIPPPIRYDINGKLVYTEEEFRIFREEGQLLVLPCKSLAQSAFANSVCRKMGYYRRGMLNGKKSGRNASHQRTSRT